MSLSIMFVFSFKYRNLQIELTIKLSKYIQTPNDLLQQFDSFYNKYKRIFLILSSVFLKVLPSSHCYQSTQNQKVYLFKKYMRK